MGNKYFVESATCGRPEPRHKLVFFLDAVSLQQRGKDNFLVRYGKQVTAELSYAEAASELGACLMHQLACDGMLDNRTKNER